MREDIEILIENKEDINEKIHDLYGRKDEAREKFLNMHEYGKQKESGIEQAEARLEQLKQDHSVEYSRDFDVQDAKLQIFKESKGSDRLKLTINGKNIFDWFKQKSQEVKQFARPHIKPPKKTEINQNKGVKR